MCCRKWILRVCLHGVFPAGNENDFQGRMIFHCSWLTFPWFFFLRWMHIPLFCANNTFRPKWQRTTFWSLYAGKDTFHSEVFVPYQTKEAETIEYAVFNFNFHREKKKKKKRCGDQMPHTNISLTSIGWLDFWSFVCGKSNGSLFCYFQCLNLVSSPNSVWMSQALPSLLFYFNVFDAERWIS